MSTVWDWSIWALEFRVKSTKTGQDRLEVLRGRDTMSETGVSSPLEDVPGEAITVLLVDDDRQWAEYLATDIEEAACDVGVIVAGNVSEAVDVFASHGDIDCIVADYRMPGKSGIQFLKHIREDHPRLPFLLVTSQGSEVVASRAINEGVTDYLIKDLADDQVAHFLSKIRTATDNHRLRQAIDESEERYRTVTEQSRDAIGIVHQGRVLFCNQRLTDLTEKDRDQLQEDDFVSQIVHPDDRCETTGVFSQWSEGDSQPQLHEMRIVRSEGEIRHCECTGRTVNYGGTTALLLSIRDVTERNRRERELQWERQLNHAIQETLVESRSREGLEQNVASQLQQYGYALAWIGELTDAELVPRAVGGDRRYLDAIDRAVDTGDGHCEPSIEAARTHQPQFVRDFAETSPSGWQETATEYAFRSGAAIPLVYNDVFYGILAVYHEEADRFDQTERRLVSELADTVAFAIHSLETRSSLASDHTTETTVQLEDGHYLVDLARTGAFSECDAVTVLSTVPIADAKDIQYVEIEGGSVTAIADALRGHPDVQAVTSLTENGQQRLQVTVTGPVPESHLASQGMVVYSTTIDTDGAVIDLDLPQKSDALFLIESLEDTFGTASVIAVGNQDSRDDGARVRQFGFENLTDKQLTALQVAYFNGYFGRPRGSSAEDIAEVLDVTHSTFLRHLRAAHRKVYGGQFE